MRRDFSYDIPRGLFQNGTRTVVVHLENRDPAPAQLLGAGRDAAFGLV
jgi:hypothetical protein